MGGEDHPDTPSPSIPNDTRGITFPFLDFLSMGSVESNRLNMEKSTLFVEDNYQDLDNHIYGSLSPKSP